MSKINRLTLGILLLTMVLGLSVISLAAEVEGPVAVTTCGQSPGALLAKMLLTRAGVECHHDDMLTAEYLQEQAANGQGFKTLLITTGTSMKGMGAAGTDINVEIARTESLIAEAKKQGMVIIGAHIEGSARRADHTDQLSIDVVCKQADVLMTIDSSNEDGYFTNLAEEKGLLLLQTKEALHLVDPLKELFNR